ncbi:MAG: hypothetical protein ACR2OZ_15460 [Verrucomicrobiales bacterium]
MQDKFFTPRSGPATWIADAAAAELKGRLCFAGDHTSTDFGTGG